MSSERLMLNRVVLPLAFALALLAPRNASAQSGNDQAVQSAAKSGVYRDLPANESRMAANHRDEKRLDAALARTDALFMRASPAVRAWVRLEGQHQAQGDPSPSVVSLAAQARFGSGLSGIDIDALVELVMAEIASDADQDLHNELAHMQDVNRQKQAQRSAIRAQRQSRAVMADATSSQTAAPRSGSSVASTDSVYTGAKDDLDNLNGLSEEQQLKLQMLMDRRQKALDMLSNLMKKQSDTDKAIIGNLK